MTTQTWLDTAVRSAAAQMAVDRAMAEVAGARGIAILRLYQWRDDTLSLGANEAALATWSRERLAEDGVAVVRRPTGGRGVWHARDDLTYAWAGPPASAAEARRAYAELHRELSRALATIRVATTLAPSPSDRADLRPGACFDLAVGGELLHDGRKLLGSAQRRFPEGLLQHGALARRDPAVVLARYRLRGAPAARSSQDGELPEAPRLAQAIAAHWGGLGASPVEAGVVERLEASSVPHRATFEDPGWTWRR